MHGTISNTPCENVAHWIENDEIHIKLLVRDAALFSSVNKASSVSTLSNYEILVKKVVAEVCKHLNNK